MGCCLGPGICTRDLPRGGTQCVMAFAVDLGENYDDSSS